MKKSTRFVPASNRRFLFVALFTCSFLFACGGSGPQPPEIVSNIPNSPVAPPMPVTGAVILKAPILTFNDTGLSVSDGVTRNGLWEVENGGLDWEFSLDQGKTWTKGVAGSFEVKDDGPKMIWVRARDDAGNTSEIVIVTCVLDTMPPPSVSVTPQLDGVTNTLRLLGIEPGARWEYSPDNQNTWHPGTGPGLGVLGNGLDKIWLRQIDVAGNLSIPQIFELENSASVIAHEASGNPLQPSMVAQGLQTILIHGLVVRGDADYVRWDIPKGYELTSVKLLRYVSEDLVAFYALQPNSVFDAGVDVTRMLVYGHLGPADIGRNVVANISKQQRGEGAMTLWFQQTGALPTQYAIEVTIQPVN